MFVLFVLTTVGLSAQNGADSNRVERLPEVQIGGEYYKTEVSSAAIQTLTSRQLEDLPTLQLSDALKYMSGVVIKDYGGLGGMKTVSVRGLGAQHTGVSYDGIPLTDCQTGQIDLGKLSLDNVSSVSLVNGEDLIFTPARLLSYSNVIRVKTVEALPLPGVRVRASFTGGSYGLLSGQLFVQQCIQSKKVSHRYLIWNITENLLRSQGDYPFVMHYGGANDSTSLERRSNSDVTNSNMEVNLIYIPDMRQRLQVKGYAYLSDRGLPSATILYNLESKQRITNDNAFAQLSYQNLFSPRWAYKLNAKFNYDHTHYVDSNYLNDAGLLSNIYQQYEGYLSNAVEYSPFMKNSYDETSDDPVNLHISLSNDLVYNQLEGNSLELAHPKRFTSFTALSLLYFNDLLRVNGNLLLTTVSNSAVDEVEIKDYLHLSPSLSFSIALGKPVRMRAFYKNIFRMPTFNDLYYREVGNLDLNPEKTHQWDLGFQLLEQRVAAGKVLLSASADGYFNIVKDKIVAFPSRNLFSWSMLNYGTVWIAGAEVNANLQYQFVKRYWLRVNGNCSYQKAVDRTDPESRTFNHQIPYTPLWSGSAGVGVETPWFTLSYALILCGDRYALGQNTPANVVEGYADHSIALGHTFHLGKKAALGLKCEFLNLANKNYEVVRNYPMQGFGWRVRIFVEWR